MSKLYCQPYLCRVTVLVGPARRSGVLQDNRSLVHNLFAERCPYKQRQIAATFRCSAWR